MGLPIPQKAYYSPEEYFQFCSTTEEAYEYEHGTLLAMGQTTDTHEDIAFNLKLHLKQATKGQGCRVHKESVSLEVDAANRYFLPDVMLTCDQRDHEDRLIKRYPSLVAEVISQGSVKRDREDKFLAYLTLPSLKYYLLLAQNQVRVEVYSKVKGKAWAFTYYDSPEDVIVLEQLNITLRVADIYEGVDLVRKEG